MIRRSQQPFDAAFHWSRGHGRDGERPYAGTRRDNVHARPTGPGGKE